MWNYIYCWLQASIIYPAGTILNLAGALLLPHSGVVITLHSSSARHATSLINLAAVTGYWGGGILPIHTI